MSDTLPTRDLYLAASATARHTNQAGWINELRRTGAERFAELGFPTVQDENWKYTNVAPIERAGFLPVAAHGNGVDAGQLEPFWFQALPAHRLVFVDGYYSERLSIPCALPAGATVGSLAAALVRHPDRVQPYLGACASLEDAHGFAALNTAFVTDGAYVHLARGVRLERPVHLLFVTTAHGEGALAQPRNLIVAEEGSQAVVVENYVSLGELRYFTNALTEVVTERNASIEHYRLQEHSPKAYHVGGLHALLGRDARFTSHAIDIGGLLVRNDLRTLLDAEGAECTLNGLYVLGGRQHVDNHTQIDHAKPHGTSREFYKGVIDGRGRAVFHGRVVVHPDAQHSDAQQVNNNLLLSRDAEADTKPQLEIYADDVKCSHGATVGQLDPDALFYLRSRALDETTARDLLTYAFARDVLTRIRLEPVRNELERQLASGLLQGRSLEGLELI